MKIKRFVLLGVVILFLLLIFGSMTASAKPHNPPSPTINVTQGEGATFSDFSNGEEPPVRIIIRDQDGSFRIVGYWAHHQ